MVEIQVSVPDSSDVMRKGISVWIVPRMLSYWFKLLFLGSMHAHSLSKCFLLTRLDDKNGLTSSVSTFRNASQALGNSYSSSLLEMESLNIRTFHTFFFHGCAEQSKPGWVGFTSVGAPASPSGLKPAGTCESLWNLWHAFESSGLWVEQQALLMTASSFLPLHCRTQTKTALASGWMWDQNRALQISLSS